ncbi:MAG: IS1380 family transposase [Anaerolineae bacterium]
MRRFIITKSEADLTSHAGLGLIGMALNERTDLAIGAEAVSPLRSDAMPHASMLSSYVALLCLGKSDFEAINGFREDAYFAGALGLDQVPSEGILRQRMDAHAADYQRIVEEAAIAFLRRSGARLTALDNGLMPLDCDVTPFINSQSKKEGVSRTYKGEDGYAPMAAYLGQEGYCLELELRAGSQHCQKGTPAFLQRVLGRARQLTAAPLLLRLDGGNDAIENIAVVEAHNEQEARAVPAHYLIKWNPRQESPEKWLAYAEEHGHWSEPRPGKRVALFAVHETRTFNGYDYPLRRVMRVIERTIDKRGQRLLVPEIEIEGWWTSLAFEEQRIIALYADHGTSEQYHSEFKTDLDIERLPSGKFATNALILACAQLAYNILRWLGQNGLLGPHAPPRHRAKRRRIRTVMQELMYLAARMIHTGRQIKLAFGYGCAVVPIFRRLYTRLACT